NLHYRFPYLIFVFLLPCRIKQVCLRTVYPHIYFPAIGFYLPGFTVFANFAALAAAMLKAASTVSAALGLTRTHPQTATRRTVFAFQPSAVLTKVLPWKEQV
ncbi:TPA: hypothetical protein ACFOVV_002140, partial [Neisseria meningitidis]